MGVGIAGAATPLNNRQGADRLRPGITNSHARSVNQLDIFAD
jgi:hypothetical protein